MYHVWILAGLVGSLGLALEVQAVDYTWDVIPGDSAIADGAGTWSNSAGNWFDGTLFDQIWVNGSGNNAIIGGGASGAGATISLGTGIELGTLTIQTPFTGTYAIDTVGLPLSIHTGLVVNEDALIQSSGGGSMVLAGNNDWNVATGKTLTVGSVIDDGAGSFGLTQSGAGTIILSGANTYDGGTTVSGGSKLLIQNESALGTGLVTLDGTGAELEIGGNFLISNPIHYSNTGNAKVIRLGDTFNATISGDITITENGDGNVDLIVGGGDTLTLTGTISSTRGDNQSRLNINRNDVNDGGVVEISGNNTHEGTVINVHTTVRAFSSTALGGYAILNGNNPALEIADGITIASTTPLTVTNAGNNKVLRLVNGATSAGYAGDITIDETGLGFFDIVTASGQTMVVSGNLSGVGRLSSVRAANNDGGTVELYGDNSGLLGGVLIDRDTTVRAFSATALGASVTLTGNNATLSVGDGFDISTPVVVADAGNNKTLRVETSATSATFSGGIDIEETSQNNFNITASPGQTLTISGVVRGVPGDGGVDKTGGGTVILSGANSFTGNARVNAGLLQIANTTALGFGGLARTETGTTVVTADSTLDLNGVSGINEPIVLTGTGIDNIGALINNSLTPASIGSGIAGLTLSGSTTGTGYSTAPAVTITGNGTGATAEATLGVTLESFVIDGGTTTYSVAPEVVITGTGARSPTATAILDGDGKVIGITLLTPGADFTDTPVITFVEGEVLAAGIDPTGVGNNSNFTVAGIRMTNAGTGYTGLPTYSIDSGNAVAGSATVTSVDLAASSSIGGIGDISIAADITDVGATGASLTKVGTGTLTLRGTSTFSGATDVSRGTLVLDYGLVESSKLSDSAELVLRDATLELAGGSGTYTEVVGSTTLNGNSMIHRSSGNSILQMGVITVNPGSTVDFSMGGIARTDNLNTNSILGSWATVGGTDWATNSTDTANGLITAFTGYADVTRLDSGPQIIGNDSTSNVRIIEGTGSAANIPLGAAVTTINSLLQSASGGGSAATIDVDGNTLQVDGILVVDGAGALTLGTAPNSGMLSTATAGGDLQLQNLGSSPVTINSVIVDNTSATSFTQSGAVGSTSILAGANTYTGATTVNGGTLQLGAAGVIPDTSILVVTAGAVDLNGNDEAVGAVTLGAAVTTRVGATPQISNSGGSATLTLGGDLTYNAGSGGVNNGQATISTNVATGGADRVFTIEDSDKADIDLLISGTLSGTDQITQLGDGTLRLTADSSSTYSGTFNIGNSSTNGGVVSVSVSGALGSGTVEFDRQGTLELSDGVDLSNQMIVRGAGNAKTIRVEAGAVSATYSGNILQNEGGTGNFQLRTDVDQTLTVSGTITGTGHVEKTGAGTVVLTGTNNTDGQTTVTLGVLQVGSAGIGTTGRGAANITNNATITGTGTVQSDSVTLNEGGTLHAGDGTATSDLGILHFTPFVGGGTHDLQGSVVLGISTATNTSSIDGSFGGNVIGSAGYIAYVNDPSRSQGLGSGNHDLLSFNEAGDMVGYTMNFLTTTGTLMVTDNAFTPVSGQIFNLLDWTTVSANFSGFDVGTNFRTGKNTALNEGALDLPDLDSSGLLWDVSQFTTSGIVVVVPEPSQSLLVGLGIGALLWRRRNR